MALTKIETFKNWDNERRKNHLLQIEKELMDLRLKKQRDKLLNLINLKI
uniref:Ribosomal protein L29 n=1 Tax=Rhizochromulina marina TaxID=1034831 RepID=A0A514CPV0_9STRA|nr:ribosomal protein L29 [Rhizochromulina marina]QDH81833.1 ribosomal protein L29 [Rhizochromulina marina]